MKAYDFQFDNRTLKSYGFIICNFGEKGLETVSDGAEVVFNTVPTLGGTKHNLVSSRYDSCLSTTLQICKGSCFSDIKEISTIEHRELTKWLNRKKFLKFKILDEDHIDIYYNASMNVSKIEFNGKLYGLELTIFTDAPFALKEPRTTIIRNTVHSGKHSINDTSYEEGYIYPDTEITIKEDGDLDIYNAMENRDTCIANCVAGEVITMKYPYIESSISSHNIQNDFNWNFFRVANTFENSRNDLIISIPCEIKIKYSPIVKVGI